jgi:hypothetical protein
VEETYAKLTISNHILSERKKELIDDRVSEMCDCCCCFFCIGQFICMHMASLYSIRKNSISFYLLTLLKINFVIEVSIEKMMSYIRLVPACLYSIKKNEEAKE